MNTFQSPDISSFVFARKQLLAYPESEVSILPFADTWSINGIPLEELLTQILTQALSSTRFGRIGIMYDHHNKNAHEWAISQQDFSAYTPTEPKRAKKQPEVHLFPTQALAFLANEGLHDTIEFRRLARKQFRKAKQANIDTLIVCDPILGEQKTRQILEHIAKHSLHLITPLDVFNPKTSSSKKQAITVVNPQENPWIFQRGSAILKQKLPNK